MIFKTEKIMKEYRDAPIVLQIIGEDFNQMSRSFGIEPVLVRVLEHIYGSSGVHEDYRGLDFRNEHKGIFLYTNNQATVIVDYINGTYPRDDGRVTCFYHSFRGNPKHFHLQIPCLMRTLMGKKYDVA